MARLFFVRLAVMLFSLDMHTTSACRRTCPRRGVGRQFISSNPVKTSHVKALLRNSMIVLALTGFKVFPQPVLADSSSPLLAAYYDNFLAICEDRVYEWSNFDEPQASLSGIRQVGVGKRNRYALTFDNRLLTWRDDPASALVLMENVKSFFAGRSGLLVIRNDDTLWEFRARSLLGFGEEIQQEPAFIASNVYTASVGDSANYYVTVQGELFVHGLAHRGQYGDGKLTATESYVRTLDNVIQVSSHTGHALALKNDGGVWGTGGNIYGPLGNHGYGDKATRWGLIMKGASAIATGSSHSVALKPDASLWIWGKNEDLNPRRVMTGVSAAAAGSRGTMALSNGALWQWNTGDKPQKIMGCR